MENVHSTTDIVLATTLVSLGHSIKGLEKLDEKRYAFIFPDDPSLPDMLEQYANDKLLIEPKKFAYHFKSLKQKIFDANERNLKGAFDV